MFLTQKTETTKNCARVTQWEDFIVHYFFKRHKWKENTAQTVNVFRI